jgi:hypothetical protein
MKSTGENRQLGEKTCPSATLSTTNLTWTDPGFFLKKYCQFISFDKRNTCYDTYLYKQNKTVA